MTAWKSGSPKRMSMAESGSSVNIDESYGKCIINWAGVGDKVCWLNCQGLTILPRKRSVAESGSSTDIDESMESASSTGLLVQSK